MHLFINITLILLFGAACFVSGYGMHMFYERRRRAEERERLRAIYKLHTHRDGQRAERASPTRRARISDADMSRSRPPNSNELSD